MTETASDQSHVIELEIKIAHLEDSVKQLDDEVYRQQRQIDRLETLCTQLMHELKSVSDRVGPTTPEQEIPPHY